MSDDQNEVPTSSEDPKTDPETEVEDLDTEDPETEDTDEDEE